MPTREAPPRVGPISDFYQIKQTADNAETCTGLITNPARGPHIIECTGFFSSKNATECGENAASDLAKLPSYAALIRVNSQFITCNSRVITDTDGYALNTYRYKIPAGLGGYYSLFWTMTRQVADSTVDTCDFIFIMMVNGVVRYQDFIQFTTINGNVFPVYYVTIPLIKLDVGDQVFFGEAVVKISGPGAPFSPGNPTNTDSKMTFLGS